MIKILYIDDEPVLCDTTRLFLEEHGEFKVDTLLSAEEAMKSPDLLTYDAIVSDYQMPVMDGIAFLKEVRQNSRDIPFILFTGRGREDIVIEAINNGANFYLQKGGEPKAQFAELAHKIRIAVERRQTEESLRESEAKFRLLADDMPGFVCSFLPDGTLTYVNTALAATTGIKAPDLIGRKFFDFIDPELKKDLVIRFQLLTPENPIEVHEQNLIKPDGTKQIQVWRNRAFFNEKGKPDRFLAIGIDITKHKIAEEALQKSEERFNLFMDNLPAAVYIKNKNGRVIYTNRFLNELFGWTDTLDKSTFDLLPEPVARQMVEDDLKALSLGVISLDESVVDVHGRTRSFSTTKFIVPDIDGNSLLGGISLDVTNRKQVEEALRQANRKLNLLSGITRHDIRNQLFALRTCFDLIKKSPEDTEKTAGLISRAGEIVNAIERQILFTREYDTLGSSDPVWQNIRKCIESAMQTLHPTGINIDLSGLGDEEILADPLLQKVFFNLLDNSVRHGGSGISCIRFSSRETSGRLVITYEDNGVGIPVDEKDIIFERGYGKNTGYGLFLIREILAITGITIRETGKPGRGARFEMTTTEGNFRNRSGSFKKK